MDLTKEKLDIENINQNEYLSDDNSEHKQED